MTEEHKAKPIPKTPPRAFMRIDITTFIPLDPNDKDSGGDQGRTDPLMFEIYDSKKLDQLPDGMLAYVRKLLQGTVKHCRTYQAQPAPTKSPEQSVAELLAQENQILLDQPPQDIEPPMVFRTHLEEERICERCGWVESQCGCAEGFLSSEEV